MVDKMYTLLIEGRIPPYSLENVSAQPFFIILGYEII